jgi:hypothetical protein
VRQPIPARLLGSKEAAELMQDILNMVLESESNFYLIKWVLFRNQKSIQHRAGSFSIQMVQQLLMLLEI